MKSTKSKKLELTARLALLANGWTVHTSYEDEVYGFLATDPINNSHYKIQVRAVKQPLGKAGDMVVYAKRRNGVIYSKCDVDYIVAVMDNDSLGPLVFMFENRLLTVYNAGRARASERWIELPIALNRSIGGE